MANQQKKNIVAKISQLIDANAHYALIEFNAISHVALEEVRNELRKVNSKIRVIKNSLFEKAVNQLSEKEASYRELRKAYFPLQRQTALITFQEDWIQGLKKYYETTKANESFTFKFGFFDKQLFDSTGVVKLAQLPGKDQIMAQMIGAMKNPMARTTRALTSPMQKLVFVLSQKAQQS